MSARKLHYPRHNTSLGRSYIALCGSQKGAVSAGTFLGGKKADRCRTCEKTLRAQQGSNVDNWVKNAGGEV